MSAKEMFEALGFIKNESACYDEQHILYERPIKNGTDIETVTFKDGHYVLTTTFMRAMKTQKDIHLAIHQQMIELGWLDE